MRIQFIRLPNRKVFILVSIIVIFTQLFSISTQAHPLPTGVNHNTTLTYDNQMSEIIINYELNMYFRDIATYYDYFDKNDDKIITSKELDYFQQMIEKKIYIVIDDQPIYVSTISNMKNEAEIEDTLYASLDFKLHFDLTRISLMNSNSIDVHNTYRVQSNQAQDWNLFFDNQFFDFGSDQLDQQELKIGIFSPNSEISYSSQDTVPRNLGSFNLFERTKSSLQKFVNNESTQPFALAYLFLLSLLFGIAHTFTPGHGIAVIGSYMAAIHGTTKDAAIIATSMTLSHTGIVLLISFVYALLQKAISIKLPFINILLTIPEVDITRYMPYLPLISGLSIIVISIFMIVRRIKTYSDKRLQLALKNNGTDSNHLNSHTHRDQVHSHPHQNGHVHGHTHSHNDDSAHTHVPDHKLTLGERIWLGITSGLNPCIDAITLLIISINLGTALLGFGLLLTFSIGMALTLIVLGWIIGRGLHFGIGKTNHGDQILDILPIISSILILIIGILLMI